MVAVKYEDLSAAFEFVSSGAPFEHEAYICLDTGRIFWISDMGPLDDEEAPEDFGTSNRYLAVPHRNDLDLGKRLALRFAARELPPRCLEEAENFFRRKGLMGGSRRCWSGRGRSSGGGIRVSMCWRAYERRMTVSPRTR